jgi:AraC family transcriptional regulator
VSQPHQFPEPRVERVSEVDGKLIGDVYNLGHFQIEDWTTTTAFRLPPHAHDSLHACIVSQGAFDEHLRRGSTRCEQSSVRIDPPGCSHDIQFASAGTRCIVVEMRPDEELKSLTPDASIFVNDRNLRAALERVVAHLQRFDRHSALGAECAVLELFAQVMRRCVQRRASGTPAWLRRVRDQLDDDPAGRVDLGRLSKDAGVHRVTLARTFRDHFGMTVGAYVRKRRIDRARSQLLYGRNSIAMIAADAGFVDQSHLHRTVVRAFGLTPAAMRRASLR